MAPGSLVVVGTGIRTVGQLTTEAIAWMRIADRLLYLVSDSIAIDVIKRLNPDGAESLHGFYAEGKIGSKPTTRSWSIFLREFVRATSRASPAMDIRGVFAYPTHEAIRRAKAEGISAKMLPGIWLKTVCMQILESILENTDANRTRRLTSWSTGGKYPHPAQSSFGR